MIDLIRQSTRMSLKGSKRVVDDLLAGQPHTFTFAEREEAVAFRGAAAQLGAETDETM